MLGFGLQVTTIQFAVGASLLNDEYVDAKLHQGVKGRGIKFCARATLRLRRHTALAPLPRPSTLLPWSQTSRNSSGSSESLTPSEGTISLSVGSHDE